jgi:hypothetical protein
MRAPGRVAFVVLFTSFCWIDGNWYDRPIALINAFMMINPAHRGGVPRRSDGCATVSCLETELDFKIIKDGVDSGRKRGPGPGFQQVIDREGARSDQLIES